MEIVNHPLCTAEIGTPSDMQDGSCSGLPVAYHSDQYGTWALSFWKPDAAELATLASGGGIVLHVRAHARQHPVIGMATYPAIDRDQAAAANAAGQADTTALFNGFDITKLPPILVSCVARLWPGSNGLFWETALEKMPERIEHLMAARHAAADAGDVSRAGRDIDGMPQPYAGAVVLLETIAEAGATAFIDGAATPMRADCLRIAAALRAAARPAATSAGDVQDAARWRETLMHVGGTYVADGVRFTLRYLHPLDKADIMRGSVAQHFTAAIDAAREARATANGAGGQNV